MAHVVIAVFAATDHADIQKVMKPFLHEGDDAYKVKFIPDSENQQPRNSNDVDPITGIMGKWVNPNGMFESWTFANSYLYEDLLCVNGPTFKAADVTPWSSACYPYGMICYSLEEGCWLFCTLASSGSWEEYTNTFSMKLKEAIEKDEYITLVDCIM